MTRPDTRVEVEAPVTTDTSQWAANLTLSGASAYEDPSPRTALDGTAGRTIEIAAELNTSSDGWLIRHGEDVTDRPYGIRADGDNVLFYAGGTQLARIEAPNAGLSARDYVIAWATEPNPVAGAALRSVFMVYDLAGAELNWKTATHVVTSADAAGAFTIGGAWDGAAVLSPFNLTIDRARVSSRFHTRVETREHFVAQTSAPSIAGLEAVEGPTLPAAAAEQGGEPGGCYQAAAAAVATGRNRHRTLSPIVRCSVGTPWTSSSDLSKSLSAKWLRTLDSDRVAPICWLWKARIPQAASYILGEIQWATWPTAVGVQDDAEMTLYASTTAPGVAGDETSTSITRTVDDGVNGLGVRQRFDPLYVPRDDDGYTWIYMAARVLDGLNASWGVRQIDVVPLSMGGSEVPENPNDWSP